MTDYPNNIPAKLEIIKASEITPKEVRWLWYPYIPFGKVTLLQGDPGDGKSKLMLSLAALLSKGAPLPFADEDESGEPMTIIYQTTEDDADDTVVPRFNSAGGDGDRLIFIKEDEKSLTFGDDRINILDGIANLLFQRVCLCTAVSADGIKVGTQIRHELLEFLNEFVKQALVFLRHVLNKLTVRQNIRHSLGHHFAACFLIGQAGGVHLALNKVVDVLSARGNLVEHQFSEHIILHRIPIFNKVYELVREGAKHGVLGEVGNVLTAHQTGIDINVNLVGACGLERGLCALIIRFKLKTEDRANAKQAHHDKAIALQQPHSFSIKDCTSPYSYTFPYCSNNVPCKKSLFFYSLLTKARINDTLYFSNMSGELREGRYGGNYV